MASLTNIRKINWAGISRWVLVLVAVSSIVAAVPLWTHQADLARQARVMSAPITVDQLMRNLPAVEGKPLSVCGLLSVGFESNGLWNGHVKQVQGQPGLVLMPDSIWIDLEQSAIAPSGLRDLSGRQPIRSWVIVTGKFYSGGGFGHLGVSEYRIAATRIEEAQPDCPGVGV